MIKLTCGIAVLLCCLPVWAKPVMQWYTSHWPPYRISEGPHADQGSFDLMRKQLMAALPQYQHQVNQIHLARIVKVSASTKEDHCVFGLRYTPERIEKAYFSQPSGMLPNLAINTLGSHDKIKALGEQPLQMTELTQKPDLVGLIETDRAYPVEIVRLINKKGSNLSNSSMTSINPAQLLAAKRVDYVVDYPNRLRYFSSLNGQELPLEFKTIAGIPSFSYTYVSCSKTETGKGWITDINAALTDLKQQSDYKKAMFHWFSEQEHQLLDPHYQGFQQTRHFVPEQAETRFSDH